MRHAPIAADARREGVRAILDPLRPGVPASPFDHIDALTGGFPNPTRHTAEAPA